MPDPMGPVSQPFQLLSLSYRPGSRNVKPDAVSRQFVVDEDLTDPSPVLHGNLPYLGREGKGSFCHHLPTGTQFVPAQSTLRSSEPKGRGAGVVHALRLACHPGVQRTGALL